MIQQSKMFYVYQLIDPRDGKPFYVGKGKGRRIKDHVLEARRGYSDNRQKMRRIQEIEAAGLSVIEHKVAEYASEHDAWEHERQLISGSEDILNVLAGGPRGYGEWSRAELARRSVSLEQ